MINVGDLSAFVTEWQGTNHKWSKIIITKHYMKRWDRTAETRTSLTFMAGEWKTVKMRLDSRVIRLLKQEDFCGAIGLTYFVEKCLDLP